MKRKWQPESYPPPSAKETPHADVKQEAPQPVPGLTLYMHPPHVLAMNEYGPLMVLFESFLRSNVDFSFDSSKCSNKGLPCKHDRPGGCTCGWITNLFIEGKVISSSHQETELKSKKEAAKKALTILRDCQPIHANSVQETFHMRNEVIPGLLLYFEDAKQTKRKGKTEWYDVLMDSCQKCGLEVSWWQNFGSMFQTKWTVVLRIDSKPIWVNSAETLEDAKRGAVTTAVQFLKFNHPHKWKNDDSVSTLSVILRFRGEEKMADAYTIIDRSARKANQSLHMSDRTEIDERTGNTTFFSDLYISEGLVVSGTGRTTGEARKNAADKGLQELMRTVPVVINNDKIAGNELRFKLNQMEKEQSDHINTPNATQEAIPGLICYLQPSEGPNNKNKDIPKSQVEMIVERAAKHFNRSIQVCPQGAVYSEVVKRDIYQTNLFIGEHLFSTGAGAKRKYAKTDAFLKAYNRLLRNQPVVYTDSAGNAIGHCNETKNKEVSGNGPSTQVHSSNLPKEINTRKPEEHESIKEKLQWMAQE